MSQGGVCEIEARLWWVRAQLRMRGVPASILSAPLDSASGAFTENPDRLQGVSDEERLRLSALASSILVETAEVLKHSSDLSMSLHFLERAYKLNGDGARELGQLVEQELGRIRGKSRRRLSEEDLQNRTRLESLQAGLDKKWEFAAPAAGRSQPSSANVPLFSQNVRNLLILCVLLAVSSTAVFLIMREPGAAEGAEGETEEVLQLALPAGSAPQVRAPVLSRLTVRGGLDAVYYELGDRTGPGATPGEAVPQEKPENGKPAGKEVVNTSYPLVSQGQQEKVPAVESPAAPRKESRPAAASRAHSAPLPREEPRPVAFEVFVNPREYVISRSTDVMSRPSQFAAPLDTLLVGDRVRVDGRVGAWLRLRSQQGKTGYINGRDAYEAGR